MSTPTDETREKMVREAKIKEIAAVLDKDPIKAISKDLDAKIDLKSRIASIAAATEKFDKDYVAEVAKSKPDPETQRTLRHYQWCVTAFKIVAKIALSINIYNALQKVNFFVDLFIKS